MNDLRTTLLQQSSLALLAHGFAWMALLFLLVAPTYSGTCTTPQGTVEACNATLIAVNGWWVASLLLIPIALTGIGLFVGKRPALRHGQKILLAAALLLLAFCGGGIFTIGLFFVPSAIALLIAAIKEPDRHTADAS